MPIIYAATTDGGIRSYGPTNTSWDSVHDNNGGSHSFAVPTAADTIVYGPTVEFSTTDGIFYIYRTFFAFDVSSISSAPSSANFIFKANTYSNGDIIAVKATKPDTSSNLANADFNELTGWQSGFNNSHLTAYSAKISGAGGGAKAVHTIALNSTALSDMASLNTLAICLMNYDHDYLDSAPTSSLGVTQRFGMFFADSSGTGDDPYIEYSTGYGNDVIGVSNENIDKVIGVATANIDKVIGA